MTDQRLRDGGPWFCSEPQVHANGYHEDFGYQEATLRFGPTCNGIPRGTNNPQPPGPHGDGWVPPGNPHEPSLPRTGEKIRSNQ